MATQTVFNRAIIIENFHPQIADILALAFSNEKHFRPVRIECDGILKKYSIDTVNYGAVSYSSSDLNNLVIPMIETLSSRKEEIAERFNIRKLYLRTPKLFLTRMGNGDSLARHTDLCKISGPNFELIFLLYFHLLPKVFSGGELELYWEDGVEVIEPADNMLVIFPGYLEHAVRVVHSPSNDYVDSRFVVAGRFCAPRTTLQNLARLIRGFRRIVMYAKNVFSWR
jgi:Rps23 Pro-64 3,4-dihydroxylase Tpa1-like proline 4-hydroxylase